MIEKNILVWVCQIIHIAQCYLDNAPRTLLTSQYIRGWKNIEKVLQKSADKIERIYYQHILYPELVCLLHTTP